MIAFLIAVFLAAGDVSSDSEKPLSCGQSSCYLLVSRLGRDVTLEQFDTHFQNESPRSSLSDLQQTLRAFSIETSAWNLDWNDFQKIRGPMICHLAPSESEIRHFHVAEWRDDELWVLDPLAAHPIRITNEMIPQYQKSFSGRILVPINAVPWTWRVFGARWIVWLSCLGIATVLVLRLRKLVRRPTPLRPLGA